MRPLFSPKNGVGLTALLAALFITVHYGAIFEAFPTSKSLEPYRDGVKTTLNACYHAKYGEKYTWFEGMNYPYPEHIVAATEMPGMAIVFRWLYPFFPQVTDYAFGLTHIILLACIFLCPIFLHLIFREFGLPNWYIIPVCLGITFLSPQLLRFGPHLGLAPLCIVPALIYGLLKYQKGNRWKGSIYVAGVIFIASFFHFYFFAITVLAATLYFLFSLLLFFSWTKFWRSLKYGALMIGAPLFFFIYWLILNDPTPGRDENPWGFFHYHANFESIFASLYMPYFKWINDHWLPFEKVGYEGWAYIGIVAGLLFFILIIRWPVFFFRKKILDIFPENTRRFLLPMLLSAGVLALLSCSWPFTVEGFEKYVDYFGPLRQFRSTGRFAWVFFYTSNIIAFTAIYFFSEKIKYRYAKLFIRLFPIIILLAEANLFLHADGHVYRPEKLRAIPEMQEGNRFDELPGLDLQKYQAVVPAPYFNVGCDDWNATGSGFIVQQTLALTWQTGLPTTGAMLTRTTSRQAFRQMQMVAEPYRMPIVFEDYKNKKPLLLLFSLPTSTADRNRYIHLTEGAALLHENSRWELYEMELRAFAERIEKRKQEIQNILSSDTLTEVGPFYSNYNTRNFYYTGFDEKINKGKKYLGKGALQFNSKSDKIIFETKDIFEHIGKPYQLLLWVNVEEAETSNTIFKIESENMDGATKVLAQSHVKYTAQVFDPEGWAMVDIPFSLDEKTTKIKVTALGDGQGNKTICVDELLIKPMDTNLYMDTDNLLWKNNRYWPKG